MVDDRDAAVCSVVVYLSSSQGDTASLISHHTAALFVLVDRPCASATEMNSGSAEAG